MYVRILRKETEEFINSLEGETILHVDTAVAILEQCGHEVRYPHSKKIAPGIFELRTLGKQNIRVFFCFYRGEALILHAFIKKTNRTPKSEIEHVKNIYQRLP
jgi:phage-related protein